MKMKKTGILPDFKVYQRKPEGCQRKGWQCTKKGPLKVTGRLKSSKIRLEITACPDDWDTLENIYAGKKEELLRDLQPFIFKANEKLKINMKEARQNSINIIKTQAALLHGYISYGLKTEAYCKPLEESLKRIITPDPLELLKFSITGKKKGKSPYDPIEITKHIVDSAYSVWIKHLKINISDSDNFEITYIHGGKKFLSKEDIAFNAFYLSRLVNSKNLAIKFLRHISEAALEVMNYAKPSKLQSYPCPQSSLVVINYVKPSKTLSLQKGIIKAAFPSLSTHTKS